MENGAPCKCDHFGHCPWHDSITNRDEWATCVNEHKPPSPITPAPCVYMGKHLDKTIRRVDQPLYECRLHGQCTLKHNRGRQPSCEGCKDYLTKSDPQIRTRFIDTLKITDRSGQPTHVLRNLLNGGAAFLVCGGPSLKKCDFSRLSERGVFSLGVNNVAAFAPVSAFVCSDPPIKFHDGIFFDPKIIKFIPTPKFSGNRAKLRHKTENGDFIELKERVGDCPNTWGFERRSWLATDETWFTAPGAAWGNQAAGQAKLGMEKTANTMFLGLRLLQYLGARRIFLLGVDFHMDPNKALNENYSFGELRKPDAVASNNRQYAIANKWLIDLVPVFNKFGFEVYNCNPNSHLRAFEYVPFDMAMKFCRGKVPPEPWNLENWYVK